MEAKQFCVIGLGRFGRSVALALAEAEQEVLAIDKNEAKVTEIEEQVSQALIMDSTNEKALKTIGVKDFDWIIVAISSDIESSILTTLLLKELGAKRALSKAGSEIHAKILKKIGADKVVFPEREMGQKVAENLVSPKIFDIIELSEDYAIVEIVAPKSLEGKSIRESGVRSKYGIYIIAIKRNVPRMSSGGDITYEEKVIVAPDPAEEILKGDILVVLGSTQNIERFKENE